MHMGEAKLQGFSIKSKIQFKKPKRIAQFGKIDSVQRDPIQRSDSVGLKGKNRFHPQELALARSFPIVISSSQLLLRSSPFPD